MRVFCPEHKRGFFAPRQSPIKCGNGGHILGEFDFQGEAKFPLELRWQYCCNCEHFCPIDFDRDGLERCPVCTRRSSVLYLCDRCCCISFESNTPLQTKNFRLTPEGVPQPSCPGCLQANSADLREHTCDALGASFVTAANSCPTCQERLDIGPSFPSSVAHYLRRTKAANKLNVTFDYENELFVPVDDGEFVLINSNNEALMPLVLPRLAQFASPRDFYEFYQDFYHCPQPTVGEVQIIEPAAVARAVEGWKFHTPGVLEVIINQPKKQVPAAATPPRTKEERKTQTHSVSEVIIDEPKKQMPAAATPPRTKEERKIQTHGVSEVIIDEPKKQVPAAATPPRTKEEPRSSNAPIVEPVQPCSHCGTLIESRYGFCWQCGTHLTSGSKALATSWEGSREIVPSDNKELEDDEQTVQHEVRTISSPISPILSWAAAKGQRRYQAATGSVLKLMMIPVIGSVLVSIGIFLLTRSPSEAAAVTAAQPVTPDLQTDPKPASSQEATRDVSAPEPQRTPTQPPGEYELKKLRERRIAANGSDRSEVLQMIARTEKKYPKDYRFPYERAKLVIKVQQRTSRDEAFAALSIAAEKAISTGKAREMLENLRKDSRGDFQKLSHGRREWAQLQEALKSQNATVLNEKMGL